MVRAGRAPAAEAVRVDVEALKSVEAETGPRRGAVARVDRAQPAEQLAPLQRADRHEVEREIALVRAAGRAARAGVERRVAIAGDRLNPSDRRLDTVADELQRRRHAGPQVRRRDLERLAVAYAPHARRSQHLVGRQDMGDAGRRLPRLEREDLAAPPGLGVEPGLEVRLALPLGQLLGGRGGEGDGESGGEKREADLHPASLAKAAPRRASQNHA
jgi:hypothetical protein